MVTTATDYKLLYEQALSEQEKSLEESLEIITQKDNQIASLNFELDKFRKFFYGKKSEKFSSHAVDGSQMNLFDLGTTEQQQEDLSKEIVPAKAEEKKVPKKRATGTGRMALPENLRREIIIIEPTEDVSDCVVIGEDITEVLSIVPAEFYVKRYVRRKYARPNGEGTITGMLPERVIDKGIPCEGVIAQMIIDKYVYGLPLHRQIDKYSRMGVKIPASTASDWMLKGWKHLVPLWELLKLLVINQKYIQADESPLKVLDRNHKNGIHQGYMWVYNAPVDGLVLFDYRKGRDSSGPKQMLEGYAGILQSDGYSVYESLFANHPNILLIYCMAHARRKFVDALKDDKVKASYVLTKMQVLYALEQEMRDNKSSWEERTVLRMEKAVPVLKELEKWMTEHAASVRPTSPLGKAIAYTLPRWRGLCAYTEHGQIEIDNNLVENAIRPMAIGRKNFLFAGSHQAAEMTAAMYSFAACCKKNNVDEVKWFKDILERIQSIKQKDLYQLLPNNWEKYRNIQNN